MVHPIKLYNIIKVVLPLIHSVVVSVKNEDPFAPLINIKYVIAVIAIPPQIAPNFLNVLA